MTNEVDVMKALLKGAITAVNASANVLPIKSPGRIFTPPNDQKYYELVPLLNGAGQTLWGDAETFQGSFRIILHWPNNDDGVYAQMAIVGALKTALKKGTHLISGSANLLIYDHPVISSPLENGQDCLFPLTIRYQCYASP